MHVRFVCMKLLASLCHCYVFIIMFISDRNSHLSRQVLFSLDHSYSLVTLVLHGLPPLHRLTLNHCLSVASLVCEGRTIDSEKGSVQSPGYPNSYPNDIHCEYYFPVSEPGFRFVFEFTSLDLEDASSNGSCVFDYVEVI